MWACTSFIISNSLCVGNSVITTSNSIWGPLNLGALGFCKLFGQSGLEEDCVPVDKLRTVRFRTSSKNINNSTQTTVTY